MYAAQPEKTFEFARQHLEGLIDRLSSPETLSMSHSAVEELVTRVGRETIRLLLQGHFDLRSHARPIGVIVGADGEERTHRRLRAVSLKTVVGEVSLTREAYSSRDAGSLHPLDAELNMPAESYSFPLQKLVAIEASRTSFDDAVEAVHRATGMTVPKRQAEQISREAAVDFDDFYATRRAANSSTPEAGGDSLLVITSDAKGVAMRPEALRPETKKAAAQRSRRLEKRLSKGEKRHKKRMAFVASVYTIAPFPREASDIVRALRPIQDAAPAVSRPKPEKKRVWASLDKSPEAVLDEAFQEAWFRDPEKKKRWVGLVDGNVVQLADLQVLAEHHGVELTLILDIIHVVEYLWKATWSFHEEGDSAGEEWVAERLVELLHGRASEVARGMRQSATKRALPEEKRAAVDACADYLIKYKDFLRYHEYLEAGLPIATGIIEGACRHLVQDRMGRTGARWGMEGGEAVLRLRALRSSGDFEDYWRFHEERELERNHRALYPHGELPKLELPELIRRRVSRRKSLSS